MYYLLSYLVNLLVLWWNGLKHITCGSGLARKTGVETLPGTVYVSIHNLPTKQRLSPVHGLLQGHLHYLIFLVVSVFLPENTAVREMSSLYSLTFDVSPGSMVNSPSSGHIQPRCFDYKVDNFTGSLKNYDAKDGGIPITFGLNCLGWMVRKHSRQFYCILYFSAAVFILVNLFWLAGASGCFWQT